MGWNTTPRKDPVKDGSLFTTRSPYKKDRQAQVVETAHRQVQSAHRHREDDESNALERTSTRDGWTPRQGYQYGSGEFSPHTSYRSPSPSLSDRRSSWGSPPSFTAQNQNSPQDNGKWAQSGAAKAIRSNFENLVRSSPLPKVLQQSQHVASPVHKAAHLTSRSETAIPKPVRATLIPPPRFIDDPQPGDLQSHHLMNGFNKNGASNIAAAKLTLLHDWWIEPASDTHHCRYLLCGTEHSSFSEEASMITVDIRERLSSNVLLVEEYRKVKLIGKPNKLKMDSFYEYWSHDFSQGIPDNWQAILDNNRAKQNLAGSTNNEKRAKALSNEAHSEHGAVQSFEYAEHMEQSAQAFDDINKFANNESPRRRTSNNKDDFKETPSPSKRQQRNTKPIQRLGSIPDDDACFCGAATLMLSSVKQEKNLALNESKPVKRKLTVDKRFPGTPRKLGSPNKRTNKQDHQSPKGKYKRNIANEREEIRTPNTKAVDCSHKASTAGVCGENSNSRYQSDRGQDNKMKTESKSISEKNESMPNKQKKEKACASPSKVKAKPVIKQAIETFKVSKRGRRIVPKLEYWKNETINYDLHTGEATGITLDEMKHKSLEHNKSAKSRKSPKRKMTPKKQKKPVHKKKRLSGNATTPIVKLEEEFEETVDYEIANDNSQTDSLEREQSLESEYSSEFESVASDGWSLEQIHALNVAQLQVDPTCRNFWQEVAKNVPGKSADECFAKHFQKHPTPVTRKTKSVTGKLGNLVEVEDRIVSNAPSAAVRKQMKHMRWKRLKKFESSDHDSGKKIRKTKPVETKPGTHDADDSKFRRSSRLKQSGESKEPSPVSKDQDDDIDITQVLGGNSKPRSLAAAIVSALAEAQPDIEEEEEEDFYFTDDM